MDGTIWISRFEPPLAPLGAVVARLRNHTEQLTDSIARLMHRPDVAAEWYRARLWVPLPPAAWRRHEAQHGYAIHPVYEAVLAQLNGANIFDLHLYGMPPSMINNPPLLNRAGDDPFDLGTANRHWKREFPAPSNWFHFGASRWSYEANAGFFLDPAGAVVALLKSGEQVGKWEDFVAFFADEIERAERIFPESEAEFAAIVARYRDNPVPPENWFKRLFSRR